MRSGDDEAGPNAGAFQRAMKPRDAAEAADWEVEHHLAELADRLVELGMSAGEAQKEAERRFGSPHSYRSRIARHERRRRRTMRWIETRDVVKGGVVSALRTVRRSPGFALGVVLTLALGIGANATMFGVLDRLLFQPPAHIVDADEVRRVIVESPFLGTMRRSSTITHPDYLELERVPGFEAVAARSNPREETLGSGPQASRVRVSMVTWDFFPMLGVRPALGRFYEEAEDQPGVPGTAVISHEYWERAFASDPGVLGRTLTISSHPFTVVGITPPGFTGVDLSPVDLWLPLVAGGVALNGDEWLNNQGWYWFGAFAGSPTARMRSGWPKRLLRPI